MTIAEHSTARLTAREREVAALIAEGRTRKSIAAELGVSIETVDSHLTNISGKLDSENGRRNMRIARFVLAASSTEP